MGDIELYIYDLSKGLAKQMSRQLLGKQIDGIWHTGIVVFGREYFFGGQGIDDVLPCGTVLGPPDQKIKLGVTKISKDAFKTYLKELGKSKFRPEKYNLIEHNCNTFSAEVSKYMTGNNIPAYITQMPQEIITSPMGAMLKPFLDQLSGVHPAAASGGAGNSGGAAHKPNTNNHSVSSIGLVNFQEPMSMDVASMMHKKAHELSHEVVANLMDLQEFAQGSVDGDWGLGPTHISLLEQVDPTSNIEVGLCVLECFRLIVWRNSDSLVALMSERKQQLGRMLTRLTGHCSLLHMPLREAAGRLICNCQFESSEWSQDPTMCLPRLEIFRFCMEGLEHVDNRTTALALARNIAVGDKSLSNEEAMELGTYILHLFSQENSVFDGESNDNMAYALFGLLIKCPDLVELGKAHDLIYAADSEICSKIRAILS